MTEMRSDQISILMAVYEPNMEWLREQLMSLNRLDYPNISLYIRDDASRKVPFSEIENAVKASISSFPVFLRQNPMNLGSNRTFEILTEEAEGEWFAYCDQDDIWLPEKLRVLLAAVKQENALLACSDVSVIDGDGRKLADSITELRRHHVFHSGEGLAPGLLTRNFAIGCTMLVRAETAKAAIPFCPYMVHDHYLALFCASRGEIVSVKKPLIQYRQHGGNQTGIMTGVTDKKSYCEERIESSVRKLLWLQDHFSCDKSLQREMENTLRWMVARKRYWCEKTGAKALWKYRECGKAVRPLREA